MFEGNFNITEALKSFFGWKVGSVEIGLFSVWHIAYLLLIAGLIVMGAFLLKKKDSAHKHKVLSIIIITALCVYIFDFIIQPFMTSDFTLNIDKLPFHACTIMGIVAVFAQFSKRKWFKETAVALALTSALMYLVYPGSALGGVAPWCFKVVETFVFHGLLLAWGVLSLTTGEVKFDIKHIWYPLVGFVVICVWAAIGNICFNGGGHWDWFFITGSTFTFIPANIMPLVSVCACYGVSCLVYLIYWLCTRTKNKQSTVDSSAKN